MTAIALLSIGHGHDFAFSARPDPSVTRASYDAGVNAFCRSTSESEDASFIQDVDMSKVVRSGKADVVIPVMLALSSPERDGNRTVCKLDREKILDLHESIAYVFDHLYKGRVQSERNTNWSLVIGYASMDTCGSRINGSLSAIMSAMGGDNCQRQRICHVSTSSKLNTSRVFMMMGPRLSVVTSVVSPLLTAVRLPTISPSATHDEFTCQHVKEHKPMESCSRRHSYFYRTSFSDFFQAQAMVNLVQEFDWNLVITLASNDIYGTSLMYEFGKVAAAQNICVAYSAVFSDTNIEDVVENIAKRPLVKVIVLLSAANASRLLFDKLAERGPGKEGDLKRVWIGSDGWSTRRDIITNSTWRSTTLAVVLSVHLGVHPLYQDTAERLKAGFVSHLDERHLEAVRENSTEFICRSVQYMFDNRNCSFCNSSCNVSRCQEQYREFAREAKKYLAFSPTALLAADIVVRTVRLAMDDLARDSNTTEPADLTQLFLKKRAEGLDVTQYLKNVELPCGSKGNQSCKPFRCVRELPASYEVGTFTLDGQLLPVGVWGVGLDNAVDKLNNGDCSEVYPMLHADFGSWNISHRSSIDWKSLLNYSSVPTSSCSTTTAAANCDLGHQHTKTDSYLCCITCQPCPSMKFANLTSDGSFSCDSCGEFFVTSDNQTNCSRADLQPVQYISNGIIVGLALFGSIAAGFTAVIFHRNRDTPIVKGIDRRLTYVHMFGILGGFLTVVPRLWLPTASSCIIQEFGGFLFILATMSVSLVKTSRFARIVRRTSIVQSTEWSFSTKAQLLYASVLCGIGCLLYIPWRSAATKSWTAHKQAKYGEVYLICSKIGDLNIVLDVYIIVLIVTTCILGFITRKLPYNYNEARQVFMSAMSASMVWLVTSTPYYVEAVVIQERDLFLAVRLVGHMWSMFMWMYSKRLYVILFQPKKNTTEKNIRRTSLLSRTITKNSIVYAGYQQGNGGSQHALPRLSSIASGGIATPSSTESPSSDENTMSPQFIYPDPQWAGTGV